MKTPAWLGAAAIDAAAVLVFATAGRGTHDAGASVLTILGVAAPFLIGGLAGWLVTPGGRRVPVSWRTGVGVWAGAAAGGLLLRRLAWDRGTRLSFVVVTTLVLGLLIVGWRGLIALTDRRGTVRSSAPPSGADR